MTAPEDLQRGREAFGRRAWAESYQLLEAADCDTPLEPEDLECLARAAYLIGRDAECESALGRAHHAFLNRGDHEGAARSAFWLGFALLSRGALAPGSAWTARAGRVLHEAGLECVVQGYLLVPVAIAHIIQGDAAAAHDAFSQAAEIAGRFADRDLSALACHGRGRALMRMGSVREGIALLDQAMVAVVAGDVSAILAGDIYCSVLEACHEIFDLRRAYEWTTSLTEWCASQPDLVRFRGECLIYRAEILQLRGAWVDAERDARQACTLLSSPIGRPAAGAAFYRLAEIHRLRGELAKAEEAYRQANLSGRKPQPGLSLLRLSQGRADLAAASARGVLNDSQRRETRARMLAAVVEIMLAVDDRETARAAATELSEIAGALDAPFLSAASANATGALLLAEGDTAAASDSLRHALETWRDLGTPYEEAQAHFLIALACEQLGDRDGGEIELEAARQLFKQLGAAQALIRIEKRSRSTHKAPDGLSEREAQVLRLLATGMTNLAIADQLFISEKTVARHVSNIFNKLDVTNRAGATAWAYQHNLIPSPT